jgi:uncharacterized membrane protein
MNMSFKSLIAVLSFGVAVYAIAAYALLPIGTVLHPDIRVTFAAHARDAVHLHVFCAALALLLGPLQFSDGLRRRQPRLHRWLGAGYLGVGVGVGGVTGLLLAINAFGGPVAQVGFGSLAVAWLVTAVLAWRCILQGDVDAHRRWMTHNFALTLAAVSLRLLLPASILGGMPLDLAYPLVAWLCWLPNVAAAEWLLRPAAHGQRFRRDFLTSE